jgi:hypothetical protein
MKLVFYEENPIKVTYLDNKLSVGLLTVEQKMLFTKVSERQVEHGLSEIIDMDILALSSNASEQSTVK